MNDELGQVTALLTRMRRGDRQAAVAEVFDSAGGRLGSGFYSADSQIRVRLLAADPLRESAVGASAAGEGAPARPCVGVDYFERRLRADWHSPKLG